MLTEHLIWCVVALFLAGFVQGTLGFGLGMVSMALLPLVISVKEASPIVVIFTLPAVLIVLCAHWRHCSWRDGWLLIAGTCVGTPLGVYVLAIAPETLLMRVLGAVLLLFAVQELWSSWRGQQKLRLPHWTGFPIGALGGALGGAFNCGGPPVVAYIYSKSWRKEKTIALLQLVFAAGAIIRWISMFQSGLFTAPVVHISLWAALPVVVAVLLGTRFLKVLPTDKLRTGVFFFIGLLAIKFLVTG